MKTNERPAGFSTEMDTFTLVLPGVRPSPSLLRRSRYLGSMQTLPIADKVERTRPCHVPPEIRQLEPLETLLDLAQEEVKNVIAVGVAKVSFGRASSSGSFPMAFLFPGKYAFSHSTRVMGLGGVAAEEGRVAVLVKKAIG